MKQILSLGGGVQSSCLALMGKYDEIVFVDTSWENKETYEYIEYLQTFVDITILHSEVGMDIFNNSKRIDSLPLYTKNPDGSVGMLHRQCTQKHKINTVSKYLHNKYKRQHQVYLGISIDEYYRARINKYKYPLIEIGYTRIDCINWLINNNYKVPIKSGCIICPYTSDNRWRLLKINSSIEFKKACDYDDSVRDLRRFGIKSECYLHRYCIPLKEIDFISQTEFGFVCNSSCFT